MRDQATGQVVEPASNEATEDCATCDGQRVVEVDRHGHEAPCPTCGAPPDEPDEGPVYGQRGMSWRGR